VNMPLRTMPQDLLTVEKMLPTLFGVQKNG
jgi:hypothetical protein